MAEQQMLPALVGENPVMAERPPSWALAKIERGDANSAWTASDHVLTAEQREQLPSIIAAAESKLVSGLSPDAARACRDPLLTVAARVVPGYGEAAVSGWVTSLLASLQRYPADLVVKHVKAAQYQQFRFINEVGPWIDEQIRPDLERRRRAHDRLRMLEMQARHAKPRPTKEERISIADQLAALSAKLAQASAQGGDKSS